MTRGRTIIPLAVALRQTDDDVAMAFARATRGRKSIKRLVVHDKPIAAAVVAQ